MALNIPAGKAVTVGRTPVERSPMLRAIYHLAFAYEDGDPGRANAAAGTAVSDLLRLIFSHSGAMLYKMQAGMGDAVFTPLYLVLKDRGVKFAFFHSVTRLGVSDDGLTIDEIEVLPQVMLEPDHFAYDPLIAPTEGDPRWCWPSKPDGNQLFPPHGIVDSLGSLTALEQGANPLGHNTGTLRLADGDFDQVVLGISPAALRPLCDELIECNDRFRAAIESVSTTPTQAFQLWLRKPTPELGWAHGTNSVAGAYVEPLDTYCDMSHLIPREHWPPSAEVRSIAYFCGVLEKRDETQDEATARVKRNTLEFLSRDIGTLWPMALNADGALDPSLLVGDSADRLDNQYYRANIAGSELYVLTPAGTVDLRLPPDDSGFENLVLAGDWTRNGIDAGCVESAATSGRIAARKLIGAQLPITGEHRAWLKEAPEPSYTEYGALTTSPGPFSCTKSEFLGLVLEGDLAKLSALLRRVFDAASSDGTRYVPLGNQVILMIGHVGQIVSMADSYRDRGYASEWQAGLILPVLAGKEDLGVFIPDRILTAFPYLLVDNPISLCGGREIYGFPKALGRFPKAPGDGWRGELFTVQGFGGNFGSDQTALWQDLIKIRPDGPSGAAATSWSSTQEFFGHLLQRAGHQEGQELPVRDFAVPWSGIQDVLLGRSSQLFLKEFRDDRQSERACYSELITPPVQVTGLTGRLSDRAWRVIIERLTVIRLPRSSA